MGSDVVIADRLSVALAVKVYAPAPTLLHVTLYGGTLVVPTTEPFCRNSTRLIVPSESPAVAVIAIFAGAVNAAPEIGDVSATVGVALVPLTARKSEKL